MIRRRSSLYFDEPIDWSGDDKPGPYRQFRQRVINSAAAQRELEAQLKSSRRGWYDAEAPSPVGLTHGKRIIKAFRSQVERRAYELCVAHPANVESMFGARCAFRYTSRQSCRGLAALPSHSSRNLRRCGHYA